MPSGASLLGRRRTVDAARDAALPEQQVVLRQGARLVAQQVAHLAQLLVQGGVAGAGRAVLLLPAHLHVPVDEQTVQHMDHIEPGGGKQPRYRHAVWYYSARELILVCVCACN